MFSFLLYNFLHEIRAKKIGNANLVFGSKKCKIIDKQVDVSLDIMAELEKAILKNVISGTLMCLECKYIANKLVESNTEPKRIML